MSAEIDALYKNARAVLWVEDPETKAWLNAVWSGGAPTILLLVAGGRSNVDAVCKQAVDAGYRNVFGLVDQDYGTSNRPRWPTLSAVERVYRLDVHEVENLLLDASALAGCMLNTGGRTREDIDARILRSAAARAWWVACCQFLTDTQKAAIDGYPRAPASVASFDEALACVSGSVWFTTTAAACPALIDSARVSEQLQAAHAQATTALANGSWRDSFPGKQLFREIGTYVYHRGRGLAAQMDLVKAVGAWQLQNGVPQQAVELRDSILGRI